jgi:hypothetical protein
MGCHPKTKCRREKLHNKMNDNSAPFLDQLFWQYLCFTKHFRSFVNLRMFWWQYRWWHHLSQTQLASCSPSSSLDSWKFCDYSNEWPKTPPWYSHLLSGLYHLETVVVWDLTESRQQAWSLTDAGRQTRVDKVYPFWQRHLSSWCYSETWLNHIAKISHLECHLPIYLSSSFWNPWQNLQFFLS